MCGSQDLRQQRSPRLLRKVSCQFPAPIPFTVFRRLPDALRQAFFCLLRQAPASLPLARPDLHKVSQGMPAGPVCAGLPERARSCGESAGSHGPSALTCQSPGVCLAGDGQTARCPACSGCRRSGLCTTQCPQDKNASALPALGLTGQKTDVCWQGSVPA